MAQTYSFGGTSGGTATKITLDNIDVTSVGSGPYNPFGAATFADGTNAFAPGGATPANYVKLQIRMFSPQAGETITVQNTGGVVYTTSASSTAPSTFTSVTINTSNTGNYFYGTEAQIQALLRAITVSATGGTSGSNNILIQFSYVNNYGETGANTGGLSSGTNNTAAGYGSVSFIACYVRGTRIQVPAGRTETGDCAIEDLRIGDLLTTASGETKPVKWIGRSRYSADVLVATPSLRPVLFRRNALADGVPARDLLVSPMHGMMLDDVIVPAASLVNGSTIVRAEVDGDVEYLHVELQDHDLILAEGAVAETFVDNSSRMAFDNAAEYTALYGGDTTVEAASPRVEEGFLLEAIRRRLAPAAAPAASLGALRGGMERIRDGVLEGWAADDSAVAELELLADGEVVARLLANRYRTDLDDAGIANGNAGFTVALPASVEQIGQLQMRRIADGAILPVMEMAPAGV